MKTMAERWRILERQEAEAQRADAADEARAAEVESARAAARSRRGRPPPRALELAARHEAGHAVVATALGRTVRGCGIRNDGTGWCWIESGESADAAHLAGAVAERFIGHAGATPSRADALLVEGDGRAEILAGFEAEELIAGNWRRVEDLAALLIEAGYVGGEAVADIVGRPRLPTLSL